MGSKFESDNIGKRTVDTQKEWAITYLDDNLELRQDEKGEIIFETYLKTLDSEENRENARRFLRQTIDFEKHTSRPLSQKT